VKFLTENDLKEKKFPISIYNACWFKDNCAMV